MAGFSNYLENKVLDHIFTASAFTQPAKWLALFTTAPNFETGAGGVECSGLGYARIQVANGSWQGAAGGATQNSADATFPAPGIGGWGLVVAFGIYDLVSAGNFLMGNNLTIPKTINQADVVRFLAGDIDITLD